MCERSPPISPVSRACICENCQRVSVWDLPGSNRAICRRGSGKIKSISGVRWALEATFGRNGLSYLGEYTVMDNMNADQKKLPPERREELLNILKTRFEKNMNRHEGLEWAKVQAKLVVNPERLWSLNEMERTGGEPDVIGHDSTTGEYIFCDCSAESPQGRRSICYDREALESRKKHKPENSAVDMAAAMGIELLTEEQYRELQKLGKFDLKTSSWVRTPSTIRKLGGAIFCDRRYGYVFVYHNGAESYYAARGFRGSLRV
jgi:hypothetical protein